MHEVQTDNALSASIHRNYEEISSPSRRVRSERDNEVLLDEPLEFVVQFFNYPLCAGRLNTSTI